MVSPGDHLDRTHHLWDTSLILHVLVVDDDEAVLGLMEAILSAPQCAVDLISNPLEAVERFSAHHYDLVITDLQMPKMTGLELAAAIRALDKHVPIILVTGTPQKLSLAQLTEAGVTRLIHKPMRVAELTRIRDGLQRQEKVSG